MMNSLEKLPSIGPVLAGRLNDAGITSIEELQQTGLKNAFLRVRTLYPDACLMSLYALSCAMQGKKRGMLTNEEKTDLKAFFNSL
jgi:DNA transformation protein